MVFLQRPLSAVSVLIVSVVASPFAWDAPKRTGSPTDSGQPAVLTSQPPAPTVFARDDYYASVPANICGWDKDDEFGEFMNQVTSSNAR